MDVPAESESLLPPPPAQSARSDWHCRPGEPVALTRFTLLATRARLSLHRVARVLPCLPLVSAAVCSLGRRLPSSSPHTLEHIPTTGPGETSSSITTPIYGSAAAARIGSASHSPVQWPCHLAAATAAR